MDLSKLPRMSKTTNAEPAEAPASASPPPGQKSPAESAVRGCPYCAAPLRPGAKFCDNCGSPMRAANDPGAGMMAEAWISVGIGILLLILCPTMTKYVSSKVFHTHFAPYDACDANGDFVSDKDGNPLKSDSFTKVYTGADGERKVEVIPFTKTGPYVVPNFWNELAITLFALALIIEGVALVLSRRPIVVAFALLLTIVATLLNLVYLLATFQKYGLALISALAAIFGIYMAIYQLRLLQIVLAQKNPRPA